MHRARGFEAKGFLFSLLSPFLSNHRSLTCNQTESEATLLHTNVTDTVPNGQLPDSGFVSLSKSGAEGTSTLNHPAGRATALYE